MPDISMCNSATCPVRAYCYRNEASGTVPSEHWQAWSGYCADGRPDGCEGFSPVEHLYTMARELTPAQERTIRQGWVRRKSGYWPLVNALHGKALVKWLPDHPLTALGWALRRTLILLGGVNG